MERMQYSVPAARAAPEILLVLGCRFLISTWESEHALGQHLNELMVESYLLSVRTGLLFHWQPNLHGLL